MGKKLAAKEVKAPVKGDWFKEAKFAMFVHWGLFSQAAGVWKGKRYHGIGEWLMLVARIPVKEYETLAPKFNPTKFSAKEWVRLAKDAGMKYIVVTTKHHDGFAMYKSEASRFNIVDATPFKRDPMKELADECSKQGVRLGFYYSQFQDWHEPGGANNFWDFGDDHDFPSYFREKALPQVREILSNYGPIALVWFDTPGNMSREDSMKLVDAVRELQPDCLINSRIGNGVGDYETLGDQEVPLEGHDGLWETVDTHNDTWGYTGHDHNWKTAPELIERVVRVASKGGNYMLNVGPTALGNIPEQSAKILRQVGKWVHRNAEAIYGTTPSPLGRIAWGECTAKKDKLYLHVFDWPHGRPLLVPGLKAQITKAYFLGDKRKKPIRHTRTKGGVTLAVPVEAPDSPAVIVLETKGKVSGDRSLTLLGGYRNELDPAFVEFSGCERHKLHWMDKFGDWKHAESLMNWKPEGVATWKFRTLEPGSFRLIVTYSCLEACEETEGMLTLDGRELPFPVMDSGERRPKPGRVIFREYSLAIADLKPGTHTLTVRPTGETPEGWIRLKGISFLPVQD